MSTIRNHRLIDEFSFGGAPIKEAERVLAQWRGIDLSEEEKAFKSAAIPVSEIIPKVLANLHIDQKVTEGEILSSWEALINPLITAHAKPVALRKGVLFVSVDSNAWHAEIVRFHRKEILAKLQACFGESVIKKISFRVG
jgi:hypothetical protein